MSFEKVTIQRPGSFVRICSLSLSLLLSLFAASSPAFAATPIRSVHYSYDLLGRQVGVKFDSAAGADGVTNVYNGFSEVTSSTSVVGTFSKTLTALYDAGGRRTRLTHPDAQAFTYAYDAPGRLTNVYEGTTTATPLDGFTYNDDGTLAARSEGAGASSAAYSWDGIGRLTNQSDVIAGAAGNVSWSFTLNPASQIATEARTETSNAYAYGDLANLTRAYAVNGLNQYSSAGTATFAYDANANLTADGTNSYTYDIENRLVKAVAAGKTTNLIYDPLGRLFQTDQGGNATITRFLYDGDALSGEYSSSNALSARYVHGSNAAADDPLVWYTGTGSSTKRYLHADHLGSVVGVTNSSGSTQYKNAYDEYGLPDSDNQGRFQYTGQAYIPELGMYYYKARMYSATLGRFLQTDPIGYKDQINLYAYVGNDPVNATDPSGLECTVNTRNETVSCTIKVVIPAGQKELTRGQRAEGQRVVNNYARTVAKLLSSNETVRVGATGGRPGTSFNISAKQAGQSLADRKIYFRPGESRKDAIMNSGGNPGRQDVFTNVFRNMLNYSDQTMRETFAHEGIHSSPQERDGNALPMSVMGARPYAIEHQGPYNQAATDLLDDK